VRFSYRVINAEKAKALNDKKENPYLLESGACEAGGADAREGGAAAPDRDTGRWQDLLDGVSNKGQFVKVGDRSAL